MYAVIVTNKVGLYTWDRDAPVGEGEGAGITEGVVAVEISVVVMGRDNIVLVAMVMYDDLSQNI